VIQESPFSPYSAKWGGCQNLQVRRSGKTVGYVDADTPAKKCIGVVINGAKRKSLSSIASLVAITNTPTAAYNIRDRYILSTHGTEEQAVNHPIVTDSNVQQAARPRACSRQLMQEV